MTFRGNLALVTTVSTALAVFVLLLSRCFLVEVGEVGSCEPYLRHIARRWPHTVVLAAAAPIHMSWAHWDTSIVAGWVRPVITAALAITPLVLLVLSPVDAQLGMPW